MLPDEDRFSLDAPDADVAAFTPHAHCALSEGLPMGSSGRAFYSRDLKTYRVVFVIPGFVPKEIFVETSDKNEARRRAYRENPTSGLIAHVKECGRLE